jgi:peptidoglycan hydrolase-like protein with peptidoglycan-binding domain
MYMRLVRNVFLSLLVTGWIAIGIYAIYQMPVSPIQPAAVVVTQNTTSSSPTLSCSYSITTSLRYGMKHSDVVQLQKILNLDPVTRVAASGSGSVGQETAYFGRATLAAVIRFQEKFANEILIPNGLTKGTGFVGPSTRTKLNALCSGRTTPVTGAVYLPKTLSPGAQDSSVMTLQQILNLDPQTQVAITGPGSLGNETIFYGPATVAAVKRFQEKYRTEILVPTNTSTATGIVDERTLAKLNAIVAAQSFPQPSNPPVNPPITGGGGGSIGGGGGSTGGGGGGGTLSYNYSLSRDADLIVAQGDRGILHIDRTITQGSIPAITLTVSNAPAGVQVSIVNNSCATCSSLVIVNVPAYITPGTYPITFIGDPLGKTVTANLTVTAVSPSTPNVVATYNSNGLATLSYKGIKLIDAINHPEDGSVIRSFKKNGTIIGPIYDPVNKTSFNDATKELTNTFSWGTITTTYSTQSDRFNFSITIKNNSSSDVINGIEIFPMSLRFPVIPAGFITADYLQALPSNLYSNFVPIVMPADYGNDIATFVNEDISRPLHAGYVNDTNTATTKRYRIWVGSVDLDNGGYPVYLSEAWPKLNRTAVPPGGSDTYNFSLRFSPHGSNPYSLASDVLSQYRTLHPMTLAWTDKRPIGTISTNFSQYSTTVNPRGWNPGIFGTDVNTITPAGIAAFQQKYLLLADQMVASLKSSNAQGMIVWDLEGQENPQPVSYIGDPRIAETLAPELKGILDQYFKKFTDAGLRCGMTIRPQTLYKDASGKYTRSWFVTAATISEFVQNTIDKIAYAKQRWGCTVFYIDSNDEFNVPSFALEYAAAARAHPDVLMIFENTYPAYQAYAADWKPLPDTTYEIGTSAYIKALYPNSFSFLDNANVPLMDQRKSDFVRAIQQGDIMAITPYASEYTDRVKSIYRAAGVPGF